MRNRLYFVLFSAVLIFPFAGIAATAQPIVAHVAAGPTHEGVLGVSLDATFAVYSNANSSTFGRFGMGVGLDWLGQVADIFPPCPPNGDPPCPDGNDFLLMLAASADLVKVGPVTIRAVAGGGGAIGTANEAGDPAGTDIKGRVAPMLSYGGAVDIDISSSLGFFGQYRGYSIFTGEREFENANGPFTADVGTESKSLLSAGLALRF